MRIHLFKIPVLLLTISVLLTSCSGAQTKGIPRLTNKEFIAEASKPNTVILDVRTPAEYEKGHIAGAILMDYLDTENFKNAIKDLDPNKKYLLYCRTGKRSLNAAYLMKDIGIKKVSDLKEGITGWNGPTVTSSKIE